MRHPMRINICLELSLVGLVATAAAAPGASPRQGVAHRRPDQCAASIRIARSRTGPSMPEWRTWARQQGVYVYPPGTGVWSRSLAAANSCVGSDLRRSCASTCRTGC